MTSVHEDKEGNYDETRKHVLSVYLPLCNLRFLFGDTKLRDCRSKQCRESTRW